MKIYRSAFLSLSLLLTLVSCGGEQFGTSPVTGKSPSDPVKGFEQASCSNRTLIKPEVDILYVVDNSPSSYYVGSDIKTAIQNTITSISSQFDYRVIGTPLIETPEGNQDYQVLSESATSLPASIPASKIVTSSTQFSFFSKIISGKQEVGLGRVHNFIASHQNDLFRKGAYLFVVLVSNGRDVEVQELVNGESEPRQITAAFNARKLALLEIKKYLENKQLRLFSVTAHSACVEGYINSSKSYGAMSQALYDSHAGFPTKSSADHYDLCSSSTGISAVFRDVNANIQQIIIPHKYKYWPITFSETATGLNTRDIKIYKSSPTQTPTLLPASSWTYINNDSSTTYNTRIEPTPGEPSSARHMVQFTTGNEIVYPDCVQITSSSNLEYFGYVVLPKVPKIDSIRLKINNQDITQSSTNGWAYVGQRFEQNIKVEHNGYLSTPAALRTGYMLQLNGSNNYYKSGDNVEIYYVPASN